MSLLRRLLSLPPLAHLPVHVRKGVAAGARWSLFPHTAYWRGAHEPEIQRRVAELWDWTGKNAWDLGAHYGLFAIGLARRAGPSGQIAAFEPNPLSFSRLQLHAWRNRLPNLRLFPFAVGEHPATLPLVVYDGFETTSSHLPYESEVVSSATPRLDVPVVRLDDLVAAGALAPPHFIKMDVEGHGHHALRGAAQTVRQHLPVIECGFHSPQETQGVSDLLFPLGYRAESLSPGFPSTPTEGGDYLWRPPSA
jgi:FkbM family methyltransferase